MQYENNQVAQILGTKYPLIQAPMSWVTDAKLVAAVSNAGGLGVLGPNAGQTELTRDPAETIARMRAEIRKTRALTDKPFGINLLTFTENGSEIDAFVQDFLHMALDENVRHFAVVGNAHQGVFAQIKQHDGVIIFRPLTPTVENMRQGEQFGADILVATGSDEGGTLPAQLFGTFTVVPTMADAVGIPVLAAGGINDRRGVNAAFALGAAGVYIGTRFIATQESPSALNVKQKILGATFADLVQLSPVQRSIRTAAADKIAAKFNDPTDHSDTNSEIARLGGLRPAMLAGDLDNGIITVNTGVGVINSIPTVAELVQALMA